MGKISEKRLEIVDGMSMTLWRRKLDSSRGTPNPSLLLAGSLWFLLGSRSPPRMEPCLQTDQLLSITTQSPVLMNQSPHQGKVLEEATPYFISSFFSTLVAKLHSKMKRARTGRELQACWRQAASVFLCICALSLASGAQNSQSLSFREQLLPWAGKEVSFYSLKIFIFLWRISRRRLHLNWNRISQTSSLTRLLRRKKRVLHLNYSFQFLPALALLFPLPKVKRRYIRPRSCLFIGEAKAVYIQKQKGCPLTTQISVTGPILVYFV